jgi:hypothetical protein
VLLFRQCATLELQAESVTFTSFTLTPFWQHVKSEVHEVVHLYVCLGGWKVQLRHADCLNHTVLQIGEASDALRLVPQLAASLEQANVCRPLRQGHVLEVAEELGPQRTCQVKQGLTWSERGKQWLPSQNYCEMPSRHPVVGQNLRLK